MTNSSRDPTLEESFALAPMYEHVFFLLSDKKSTFISLEYFVYKKLFHGQSLSSIFFCYVKKFISEMLKHMSENFAACYTDNVEA
jgi:hypothetical protein